jgi:hypothetical protein
LTGFRCGSLSRANQPQNHLGTHRAIIHALPPSLCLRFVPFSVPSVFVRWRSSEEQKQAGNGRKGKNNEIRRDQKQDQRRLTKLFAFAANSDISATSDVSKNPVFNAYLSRTQDEYQRV